MNKPHSIVILMDGGLIQEVFMDDETKKTTRVVVVDMDVEGTTEDIVEDLHGNEVVISQYGDFNASGPCDYMRDILEQADKE